MLKYKTEFILKMHPIKQKDFLKLANSRIYAKSIMKDESGKRIGKSILFSIGLERKETQRLVSISIYDDGRIMASDNF